MHPSGVGPRRSGKPSAEEADNESGSDGERAFPAARGRLREPTHTEKRERHSQTCGTPAICKKYCRLRWGTAAHSLGVFTFLATSETFSVIWSVILYSLLTSTALVTAWFAASLAPVASLPMFSLRLRSLAWSTTLSIVFLPSSPTASVMAPPTLPVTSY